MERHCLSELTRYVRQVRNASVKPEPEPQGPGHSGPRVGTLVLVLPRGENLRLLPEPIQCICQRHWPAGLHPWAHFCPLCGKRKEAMQVVSLCVAWRGAFVLSLSLNSDSMLFTVGLSLTWWQTRCLHTQGTKHASGREPDMTNLSLRPQAVREAPAGIALSSFQTSVLIVHSSKEFPNTGSDLLPLIEPK